MTNEIRPTPILTGKSAERFHEEINKGQISKNQKEFLDDCRDLVKEPITEEEYKQLREQQLSCRCGKLHLFANHDIQIDCEIKDIEFDGDSIILESFQFNKEFSQTLNLGYLDLNREQLLKLKKWLNESDF